MSGLERPLGQEQQQYLRQLMLQHNTKLSEELDKFANGSDTRTRMLVDQANIHLRQIACLLDTLTESAELRQQQQLRQYSYVRWGLLALVALNLPNVALRLNDLAQVVKHFWGMFP